MAEAPLLVEKYPIPRFVIPDGALDPKPAEAKPELAPKPAEPAPATEAKPEVKTEVEGEVKETTGTDPESVKRSTRSYERRVDRLAKQRAEALVRAEAAEKRIADLEKAQQPPPPSGKPNVTDFTDIGEFEKALDKFARAEAVKDYEKTQSEKVTRTAQERVKQSWEEKVAKAVEKYDDFEEKLETFKVSKVGADAIMRADNGTEVANYLMNHDKEAETIFSLGAPEQILEIGKLSYKLTLKPEAPKTPSKAPPPIAPVTGAGSTADDDAFKPQSPEEYMKKGNKLFRGR